MAYVLDYQAANSILTAGLASYSVGINYAKLNCQIKSNILQCTHLEVLAGSGGKYTKSIELPKTRIRSVLILTYERQLRVLIWIDAELVAAGNDTGAVLTDDDRR